MISVKCPNCGEDIQLEEGKANVFCPSCGKKLALQKKDNQDEKTEIIKERLSIEREKMEMEKLAQQEKMEMERLAKQEERERKERAFKNENRMFNYRIAFIIVAAVIALVAACIIVPKIDRSIQEEKAQELRTISVPASARKYRGENYKEVVKELEDAGFDNIETVPFVSKIKGKLKKNKIKEISIEGKDHFKEGDTFDKSKKIRITYYTNKKKGK